MRPNTRSSFTAVIANGASLSGAVDIVGLTLVGVLIPSSWTTADLTFQVSVDGSTYVDVYNDSGVEYLVQVGAASTYIVLNKSGYADFAGMRYLKVRSGTSGTPVNQGGARTLTLICKG